MERLTTILSTPLGRSWVWNLRTEMAEGISGQTEEEDAAEAGCLIQFAGPGSVSYHP